MYSMNHFRTSVQYQVVLFGILILYGELMISVPQDPVVSVLRIIFDYLWVTADVIIVLI